MKYIPFIITFSLLSRVSQTARSDGASLRILLTIVLMSMGTIRAAGETMLNLEDVKGRSIRAEIVELNGDDAVTIRRDDGQLFAWLPLKNLSEDSRKQIQAWAKRQEELKNYPIVSAESNLAVRFSRGRDDDLNDDGDPDDRVVVMEPTVSILNKDFNTTYRDVEGIVVVIGESAITSGEMKILFREKFTLTLPYQETVRWQGKTFTNRYDENPRNGSAHGYKYEDYLIILYDPDGNTVYKTSSRKKHEENASRILKANPKKSYDEDFEREVPESRI